MYKLLIFLFIIFFGCISSENKNKRPPEILSEEVIIPILRDIHFAESAVQSNKLHKDSADHQLAIYYTRIFKIHDVSKEQFLNSFHYYNEHPDELSKIYEELLNEMSEIEAKMSKVE